MHISKHPLFISLVGIFLGSILIPTIGSYYSDHRYQIDKKNEIAFSIIENNGLTISRLNNVLTSIEIFNKDSLLFVDPLKIREFQINKSGEVSKLYLEFNENSWHWWMSVLSKIKTLDYTTNEIDSMKSMLMTFKKNLVEETELVDQLWTISLRREFDSLVVHREGKSIRDEFNRLENKNNEIASRLAYFIKKN